MSNILNIQVGAGKPELSKEEKIANMELMIERYKVQNPVKYAAKEAELAKKLAELKGVKVAPEAPTEAPTEEPKLKVKKSK